MCQGVLRVDLCFLGVYRCIFVVYQTVYLFILRMYLCVEVYHCEAIVFWHVDIMCSQSVLRMHLCILIGYLCVLGMDHCLIVSGCNWSVSVCVSEYIVVYFTSTCRALTGTLADTQKPTEHIWSSSRLQTVWTRLFLLSSSHNCINWNKEA